METRGRALYNLLRMNWQEDPSLRAEPWQVEDYRAIATEELFFRLSQLGVSLDEPQFLAYAREVDSPEELTEALWAHDDLSHYDRAYLLIFELWRRLAKDRQSLSIFCDQLDLLISLYDQDRSFDEEELSSALVELERILDEHVDQGEQPRQLFREISFYCAHDLESFIYDFAAEEIDRDHHLNASEIIEGFSPYVSDEAWFEFLQLRLLAAADPDEAEAMLARIIDKQQHQPNFELMLEIARFLAHGGATSYFLQVMKQLRPHLQAERDFQELLVTTSQFYRLLDRDCEAEKVVEILARRKKIPLETAIDSSDCDLEEFYGLVDSLDLDRSET